MEVNASKEERDHGAECFIEVKGDEDVDLAA